MPTVSVGEPGVDHGGGAGGSIAIEPAESESEPDHDMELGELVDGNANGELDSEDLKLLKEWYISAFTDRQGQYLTMMRGEEMHVMQLLSLKNKNILVDSFLGGDDQFLFRVTIQPFEIWSQYGASTIDHRLDVFEAFEDPVHIDLYSFLRGADFRNRSGCQVWEETTSTIPGCVRLHKPSILNVRINLSHSTVPVLCLLDALEAAAWTPHHGILTHTPLSGSMYDSRHRSKKRCYFQCLLAGEEIWRSGAPEFRSNQPQWFFKLLLAGKYQPTLSVAANQKLLRSIKSDALPKLQHLQRQAPNPRIRISRLERVVVDPAAGHDDIIGDADTASEASHHEDHEIAPDVHVAGLEPALEMPPPIPEQIEGQAVLYLPVWTNPEHPGGLRVSCPRHVGCSKYRSLLMWSDEYGSGVAAATAYLGRWVTSAGSMTVDQHRQYKPTLAETRAYSAG